MALAALTVRHAFLVRALLPGRTSALHDEVTRLDAEATRLRAEQESLRGIAPDPKALARWLVVKDLVDRRAFSWTNLFARLEERIPDGARLVSITPKVTRGEIVLDVQAMVRSPEVGWQFVRTLDHILKMKDQAIVCNIGHFDNEIQVDKLNTLKGVKKINVDHHALVAVRVRP